MWYPLKWVAYPFSSGSSQPKNQTRGLLHCRRILYQLSYEGISYIQPHSWPNSYFVFLSLFTPIKFQFDSVQSLSHLRLFATSGTAAQASLSITNSRSLLKLTSIVSMMPSNHLILCRPLLLPPSIFPSIRVFSNDSALNWRRQWQPTPVLLPGKSHGWRSLVGCSPWGCEESRHLLSDFTFTFHFHALEKEMATHSSVLAWRISGMVEPGGLPFMGSHRVGHY